MILIEDIEILKKAIENNSKDIIEISISKCVIDKYKGSCQNCILHSHTYLQENDDLMCYDLCDPNNNPDEAIIFNNI